MTVDNSRAAAKTQGASSSLVTNLMMILEFPEDEVRALLGIALAAPAWAARDGRP